MNRELNQLEQINGAYYRVIYALVHHLVDDYIKEDELTEKMIVKTLIEMVYIQPSDVEVVKPIIRDYLNDTIERIRDVKREIEYDN